LGIIVAAVLVLYGVVWLFGGKVLYPEFYSKAEKAADIPDLWKDFVPQGVTAVEGSDETIICGYMPGSQNSRIYRISADGTVVRILLVKEDGSAYTGHAGGLTAAGEYIYISNASTIFVLSADSVLRAANDSTVQFIGSFVVPCRSSFCSSDGKMLYVGEYHAPGYSTEESHRIATKSGTYQAMVFGYRLSSDGTFGIADTEVPDVAYAVCDEVQGFAMLPDGTAVVSCSAGLNSSKIKAYRTSGFSDTIFAQDGEALELCVLDSAREVSVLKAPHMSEDLDYRNGKLYVNFEAGAKKFGGGILPCSTRSVMKLAVE
ncbi:MAG: hypothetical protein J5794_06870, partial [Lachnospiraceae bacterium]|nr:hypothetical protein [Lachnospiraceae bacterium]